MPASLAPLLAGMPGGWEVYVIILVVLLLFGSRIPKVARSLGQGISQFKKGLNDAVESADDDDEDEKPAKKEKQEKLEG